MYRRRQQRIQRQEEIIKPIEKKVIKKQEPVIKAVVKPQRKDNFDQYSAPMVNILRNEKYFGEIGDTHYVPFGKLVDTVLSKGFLNVNQSPYYIDTISNDWHESYEDTTNYNRNTFMCGDIIYTHDDKRSIAFLITKVYSGTGETQDNSIESELDMDPPVGPKEEDPDDGRYLSSFVNCEGTVYMFKEGTKFENIKEFASKYTSGDNNGQYRKLYASNLSKYDGRNSSVDSVFTSVRKGDGEDEDEKPQNYPQERDLPTAPEQEKENQFNLTKGVVVEGWLIYMKSNKEGSEQTPDNIIGDIIRTGPITISLVGSYLSLSGVLKFPFLKKTVDQDTSEIIITPGTFYYNGNSTDFASEPLNSEHYQNNYNDTKGSRMLTVDESSIYSLKQIIANLTPAPEPEP